MAARGRGWCPRELHSGAAFRPRLRLSSGCRVLAAQSDAALERSDGAGDAGWDCACAAARAQHQTAGRRLSRACL